MRNWEGARVVEWDGLENRCGPPVHRGFESLPSRQKRLDVKSGLLIFPRAPSLRGWYSNPSLPARKDSTNSRVFFPPQSRRDEKGWRAFSKVLAALRPCVKNPGRSRTRKSGCFLGLAPSQKSQGANHGGTEFLIGFLCVSVSPWFKRFSYASNLSLMQEVYYPPRDLMERMV